MCRVIAGPSGAMWYHSLFTCATVTSTVTDKYGNQTNLAGGMLLLFLESVITLAQCALHLPLEK